MNARDSDPKPKYLVVLSDDGFQRLNSHSLMRGLLKDGKNLHCVDVEYGPLLLLKTSVPYAANGSKEVRHMTVGLSIQYNDVSFVLSSESQEQRSIGNQFQAMGSISPATNLRVEPGAGTTSLMNHGK